MAPVLIGGAALSVDVSRMYNLDHDLQSAADSFARAGAAELDQRGDSLERAARAVSTLVQNEQKFGNQGRGGIAVDSVRYLKRLPANDYDPVTSDMVTTNAAEAHYVEVKVKPVTVDVLFPSKVVNAVSSAKLEAKSVAGNKQSVCGVAPVFVCNPYENSETSIYEAMNTRALQRRQVKFTFPGSYHSTFNAGYFGFLDIENDDCDLASVSDGVAIDIPKTCFSKTKGVGVAHGNISTVRDGLNTRFDIYKGSFKNKKSNPRYAPAANVVKGYSGNKVCKIKPNNKALGLPRDACFEEGTCTKLNGRMGNGDWDFVEYMKINHNWANQLKMGDTTYHFNYNNHTVSPSDIPSRYEMYRWEIENNCVPGSITYGQTNTPEEGLPQCHYHGASTAPIDRRILYVAVLNCGEAQDISGSLEGGYAHRVETFAKVFLTEPMGKGSDTAIWGELVGPVVEGVDTVSRDKVMLTRY